MPSRISRRFSTTSFSSLNGGMPKVSSPPMRVYLSNTTGCTPLRARMSAQPRPAGPAPMIATRLPVLTTPDMSGFQPCFKASSVMYFSMEPMVTAPSPSLSVHAPSHRRSCGQMRPQTSGSELVWCESSAACSRLPSCDQLQPVRNVVVHRALPLAERIAAGQAATGLLRGTVGVELRVDFLEFGDTHVHRSLLRVVSRDIQELQVLVRHSLSRPSRSPNAGSRSGLRSMPPSA